MSAGHARLVVPTADCSTERVAQMAGLLSSAVMAYELSLASTSDSHAYLWRLGFRFRDDAENDDLHEAHSVAARMIEDRARRATAFREPRR